MIARVLVKDTQLLKANVADFPLKAKRFTLSIEDEYMVLDAQDLTAFRAGMNAVWTSLAASDAMKNIR